MAEKYFTEYLKYKPDAILTYPFTGVGLARFFHLYKFFLGAKIITFSTEGGTDLPTDRHIKLFCGLDKYSDLYQLYEEK